MNVSPAGHLCQSRSRRRRNIAMRRRSHRNTDTSFVCDSEWPRGTSVPVSCHRAMVHAARPIQPRPKEARAAFLSIPLLFRSLFHPRSSSSVYPLVPVSVMTTLNKTPRTTEFTLATWLKEIYPRAVNLYADVSRVCKVWSQWYGLNFPFHCFVKSQSRKRFSLMIRTLARALFEFDTMWADYK